MANLITVNVVKKNNNVLASVEVLLNPSKILEVTPTVDGVGDAESKIFYSENSDGYERDKLCVYYVEETVAQVKAAANAALV